MSGTTQKSVAVIGSGLGGLSAAATLAARGHKVSLFEANSWLGGKAAVLEEDGFRFDMGPTILTVPAVLERIFGEAGRKLDNELDLVRLDPQWRCFFDGGSVLDLREGIDDMASEIEAFAGDGSRFGMEIAYSREDRELSLRHLFQYPTPALLARHLQAAERAQTPELPAITPARVSIECPNHNHVPGDGHRITETV